MHKQTQGSKQKALRSQLMIFKLQHQPLAGAFYGSFSFFVLLVASEDRLVKLSLLITLNIAFLQATDLIWLTSCQPMSNAKQLRDTCRIHNYFFFLGQFILSESLSGLPLIINLQSTMFRHGE